MNVTIELYGRLKAAFGHQAIECSTQATTVEGVYRELCTQHQQEAETRVIRPIINDTFCDWSQTIKSGDVLGFFPPASGG